MPPPRRHFKSLSQARRGRRRPEEGQRAHPRADQGAAAPARPGAPSRRSRRRRAPARRRDRRGEPVADHRAPPRRPGGRRALVGRPCLRLPRRAQHGHQWVGWPGMAVPAEEQEVRAELRKTEHMPFECVLVFLDEATAELYNGFCNNVLWPLLHYIPGRCSRGRRRWRRSSGAGQGGERGVRRRGARAHAVDRCRLAAAARVGAGLPLDAAAQDAARGAGRPPGGLVPAHAVRHVGDVPHAAAPRGDPPRRPRRRPHRLPHLRLRPPLPLGVPARARQRRLRGRHRGERGALRPRGAAWHRVDASRSGSTPSASASACCRGP